MSVPKKTLLLPQFKLRWLTWKKTWYSGGFLPAFQHVSSQDPTKALPQPSPNFSESTFINQLNWLVVEPYPSEKMMDLVSWDDEIPNIWWLFPTEWKVIKVEKYELVSWDDDIPNWMESHKSHVPNMSKPPTRSTFINQEACHQQPLLPRSVCQGTARGGFLNSSISSSAASAFTSAAGERHGHVSCFNVLLCVCV